MHGVKYRLVINYFCGYTYTDGTEDGRASDFVIKGINKKPGVEVQL